MRLNEEITIPSRLGVRMSRLKRLVRDHLSLYWRWGFNCISMSTVYCLLAK